MAQLLPFRSLEVGLDVHLVKDGEERLYQVTPRAAKDGWTFWIDRGEGTMPKFGVRLKDADGGAWLEGIALEVRTLIAAGWQVVSGQEP